MGKISKFFRRGKQKESQAAIDETATTTTMTTSETDLAFPDGVKVWIDPPDAAIDVCFVHGLTGDRDATWTAPGYSEPWPSRLLPDKLPKARLLTYGYDAYVVRKSVASINTLNDHATNLLRDLSDDRESCDAASRPIVFVAHSLGGLICKETVLKSRNNPERHLRKIFDSVAGVVFMGTPHIGSWIADWAKIPARTLGVLKSTNRTLLEVLRTENQLLDSIQERFLSMVRELREDKRSFEVTCFYEELPLEVLDRVVVTKTSATFEGYPLGSIHANHSNMVKFVSVEESGFKRISADLTRWARTAHDETTKNCTALPYYWECLRSLSFPEMDDRFKDIDYATNGTCEWLLEHDEYKQWAASDRGLLWIKGKPGSGKSTLLQYSLRNSHKYIGYGPLILSFFFHGRGVELQKTPLGFFRSLLHQLLCHVPDSLSDLVTTFEKRCDIKGKPNEDWHWHSRELLDFLKSSLSTTLGDRSIWLFVDALDECGKENAIDLVRDLKALLQESPSTNPQFHICFTCRHYPIFDLGQGFEICIDDQNRYDISTYVKDQLSDYIQNRDNISTDIKNQLSAYMTPEILIAIVETIIGRASGVFLWARLMVQRVIDLDRGGAGWKEIKKETSQVPTDLNDLYQDIVRGMNDKSSLKLIQWICLATRPLTLVELQWAMLFDAKCTNRSLQEYQSEIVDSDRMKKRLRRLSCGLAETVQSSNEDIPLSDKDSTLSRESGRKEVVQFIHQSVKDFFIENDGLSTLDKQSTESAIENAHYQLSRSCIRCFTMKEVDQLTQYSSEYRMSEFPLLRYAIESWAWHENEIKQGAVSQGDLLDHFDWPSETFAQLWARLYTKFHYHYTFDLALEGAKLIHIASHYQLIRLLQVILLMSDQRDVDIDPKDKTGHTPLSYAARDGRQAVVQLLLDTGKVNADSKNLWGQTPLLHAARAGHQAVVQLLEQHDHTTVTADPSL